MKNITQLNFKLSILILGGLVQTLHIGILITNSKWRSSSWHLELFFLFSLMHSSSFLWAETFFDNHIWYCTQNDIQLRIKIQQLHRSHLSRRAAWISRGAQLHDVRMRILLHKRNFALAGTVVCIVLLGRYDPVPSELVEVDCQVVTTTAALHRSLLAPQAAALCASLALITRQNVDEWTLRRKYTEKNFDQPLNYRINIALGATLSRNKRNSLHW